MPQNRQSRPEDFLPLRPVQYQVLIVLAGTDLHAYALVREIRERSGGVVRPGPASIHRTLRQLRETGLIEESAERPAPELDDARRRYFRLTELGREVALAETARLGALVAAASADLGGSR